MVAWMDSKPVHLLSTFPPFHTTCLRNATTAAGGHAKAPVPQPSTIPVYNSAMCGTDLEDQNASYFDARKRIWRWQHRLYMHFNNISSINAKTLYNCAQQPANKMTLLKSKMQLVMDWCTPDVPSDDYDADDGSDDDGFSGDEQDLRAPTSKWHEFDCHYFHVRNTGKHTPQQAGTHKYSPRKRARLETRVRCAVCDAKSSFQCRECGVYLCMSASAKGNCWENFHGKKHFRESKRHVAK